ncbi:MAG: DUF3157 family protein [Gammaproteobacteria bacterium]|nr:DUF3157 family protein [Gammaproteobacteria bacterium]
MVRNHAFSSLIGTAIVHLSILLNSPGVFAAQEAISDDGREVLLKDNGTWEFQSNDRYANMPDGRRVRLKEDNTWEYIGNVPLTTKTKARTETTDITLQSAVVETHQEKNFKNIRTETQTVFNLQVDLSPLADKGVTIDNSALARIKVTDNKGEHYTNQSLIPGQFTLAPGSQQTFTLRVIGSPSWLKNPESIKVELAPGIFGNPDAVELTMSVNDLERKVVEGFPDP